MLKQNLQNQEVKSVQNTPKINKNTVRILMTQNQIFDGSRFVQMKVEDRLTQMGQFNN
jgi:uncharacterized protein YneF (UPF0154 family)